MLRFPILAAIIRGAAHRRLRRLGGTETVTWAMHVPLVTLVVVAAVLLALPRRQPGGDEPR